MPECDNCGAHVTHRFYRVFSIDGELPACLACGNKTEMTNLKP